MGEWLVVLPGSHPAHLGRGGIPVRQAPGNRDGLEVQAMKCSQCDHSMKTARENYLYRESGLPNITLVGIEVSRCSHCGEHEAVIPKIERSEEHTSELQSPYDLVCRLL